MNTTSTRMTVSTAAALIVPAEGEKRTITFIPPASPQMFFMIDATPEDIADCRAYQWCPMGTYPFTIELDPGQFVSAIADTAGQNAITVICKYHG